MRRQRPGSAGWAAGVSCLSVSVPSGQFLSPLCLNNVFKSRTSSQPLQIVLTYLGYLNDW